MHYIYNKYILLNMRFSDKIPKQFIEYQKQIKPSLKALGISQAHVYRSIGMSITTWNRRIKNCDFTANEVLAICKVINK